ncbi:MAG: hypothetical protein LBQ01_05085 [Prevotellaceae bacterium]|nr:hypothetical protein [Prevotellaceae bacterium]
MRAKCLKNALVRAGKRKEYAHNFETAKTMGVIYPFNISMDVVLSVLNRIAKQYDIELVFMIYFPQDKLPEGIGENSPSRIVFSNNECNWFGKPETAGINSFINTEFDIFIDLSSRQWFPLQYIAISSHALFKIGRINGTDSPYSLVLLGSESEERFIKDLETYLYKIK